MTKANEFQPALPMRGVTSTHTRRAVIVYISTRTPHAGSDDDVKCAGMPEELFQPALPMRGVTNLTDNIGGFFSISTRTPHAGSDCNIMCKFTASINI